MRKMTCQKVLGSLITAVLAAFCLIPIGAAYSAAPEEIRVSYSPMPLNAPTIISTRLDFVEKAFKDEGIDVKYSTFQAGPQMTEAFAAKALDIASVMGATSAIAAKAAGVDIKVVAAYSMNPQGFAIVVPYDSNITDLEGLKGKRVAGPKGTAVHQLLIKALETTKLSVKDVEFVNMLVPDTATALIGKQVDAGLMVEPQLTKLVDAKKIRILKDGSDLIGGLTVIVARGDLVRDNKNLVKKFLKAHQQAVKYVSTRQAETMDAVADETKLTKDQVRRLLPKYDFEPALRSEVLKELKDCADFMYNEKMIKQKVDIDDLVAKGLLN